jgi:hypothetical protein
MYAMAAARLGMVDLAAELLMQPLDGASLSVDFGPQNTVSGSQGKVIFSIRIYTNYASGPG